MKSFIVKLTEGNAKLFGYHPGVQIGPIKVNRILNEYFVYDYSEKDYSEKRVSKFNTVKIIELECSIN